MDWKALADRLEDGAKVYKAFQDGEQAVSMLAGFERAKAELQAQYDALPPQIARAKEELKNIHADGEAVRAEIARSSEAQRKAVETAHADRIAGFKAEADAWDHKLAALKEQFQSTLAVQEATLKALDGKIEEAKRQIAALEAIKGTVKAQLERVS